MTATAIASKLKTILDEYAARLSRRYRTPVEPPSEPPVEPPVEPEAPEVEVDSEPVGEAPSEP